MAKTALNINKAFTFVFEDPNWVRKIGIAGFLTLTLIGAIPVAGWALEIQRRLIRTGKSSLPEWDAMGQYAINGLKFMLLWVITLIPFYLLAFAAISFAGRDRESFYLVTLLLQVFSFFFSMAMLLWMAVLSGRFAETYSFYTISRPAVIVCFISRKLEAVCGRGFPWLHRFLWRRDDWLHAALCRRIVHQRYRLSHHESLLRAGLSKCKTTDLVVRGGSMSRLFLF